VNYPLGVDVGTTYTAAALWRDGRVQTVPLGNRANAVPSVLFLREDGTLLVGEAAARRGIGEPDREAREFKRRMGDEVPILVAGQGFSVPQLTSRVLGWVIERVTEAQGGPPSHVVLTHPASWGTFRQSQLTGAAMSAGLRDVGLLAEPVAAATWYAAQERIEPGTLIGVYDFGGGTFDASVVRKTTTGMEIFGEAGGDDAIGGIDFDHALFRHVGAAAGVDLAQYDVADRAVAGALGQLFNSVVEAKEALSADTEAVVPVVLPGVSRQVLITRADFEDLIRTKVLGTIGVFAQVVHRAGLDPTRLHAVLLVGGSSRIPLVRQLLAQELGVRVALDAHPKHTVSLGAAIAAAPRGIRPPSFGAPGFGTPAPPFGPPPSYRPGPPPSGQVPRQPLVSQPMPYPPVPRAVPPPVPVAPVPAVRPFAAEPVVAERIDLNRTGLTAATDVPVVLASIPVINLDDRPSARATVVHTGGPAGSGRGRLTAVLVIVVIVVVVVLIAFLATRRHTTGSVAPGSVVTGTATPSPSAGTIVLDGRFAIPPSAPDTMRAVTVRPSGDLVAVGISLSLQPKVWLRRSGQDWVGVAAPPADQIATMADVAATPVGLVAVGWTGDDAHRRPAVWTSSDGTTWRLHDPAGDFAAGTGITELTAITVTGDNTLLAVAVDRKTDPTDGDAAVYTSPDGNTWTRVAATGLSGPGPQSVQRVIRTADGHLIAIGSALTGAHQGPAVWTSPDGVTWQQSAFAPDDASASLFGIVQQADGSLLACGSVGSADQPSVGCWTEHDPTKPWQRWNVTTPAGAPIAPVYVYGLVRTSDGVLAAGAGKQNTSIGATVWKLSRQPN
jgi:molecular chaperone DnaK